MFTVDLDLISIQLRHAVNAKREATVFAHLRHQQAYGRSRTGERVLIAAQMDARYNPVRLIVTEKQGKKKKRLQSSDLRQVHGSERGI